MAWQCLGKFLRESPIVATLSGAFLIYKKSFLAEFENETTSLIHLSNVWNWYFTVFVFSGVFNSRIECRYI